MCPTNIKELSQGDVIRGGRMFYQRDELRSLDRADDGSLRIVDARELDRVEQVSLLPSILCDLALLSQTCDARKDEVPTVIVAPVFSLSKLDPEHQQHCRNYRLTYAYYLPSISTSGQVCPESYIDVRYASTLNKSVLHTLDVIRTLSGSHTDQFRVFIQVAFSREGFPDDVVAALGRVPDEVRDSRNRSHVYGFYIQWDDSNIQLMAVLHEHNESIESRLKRAVDKANNAGSSFTIHLSTKAKAETTLADIEHYRRFAWDNLSFTAGTATDVCGIAIPRAQDSE